MQQGTLILSSNEGRYAVCTTDNGSYPDLTAGTLIEVRLGGHWVQGCVEFAPVYIAPHMDNASYYFVASDGSVAGLCMGMKVRIIP